MIAKLSTFLLCVLPLVGALAEDDQLPEHRPADYWLQFVPKYEDLKPQAEGDPLTLERWKKGPEHLEGFPAEDSGGGSGRDGYDLGASLRWAGYWTSEQVMKQASHALGAPEVNRNDYLQGVREGWYGGTDYTRLPTVTRVSYDDGTPRLWFLGRRAIEFHPDGSVAAHVYRYEARSGRGLRIRLHPNGRIADHLPITYGKLGVHGGYSNGVHGVSRVEVPHGSFGSTWDDQGRLLAIYLINFNSMVDSQSIPLRIAFHPNGKPRYLRRWERGTLAGAAQWNEAGEEVPVRRETGTTPEVLRGAWLVDLHEGQTSLIIGEKQVTWHRGSLEKPFGAVVKGVVRNLEFEDDIWIALGTEAGVVGRTVDGVLEIRIVGGAKDTRIADLPDLLSAEIDGTRFGSYRPAKRIPTVACEPAWYTSWRIDRLPLVFQGADPEWDYRADHVVHRPTGEVLKTRCVVYDHRGISFDAKPGAREMLGAVARVTDHRGGEHLLFLEQDGTGALVHRRVVERDAVARKTYSEAFLRASSSRAEAARDLPEPERKTWTGRVSWGLHQLDELVCHLAGGRADVLASGLAGYTWDGEVDTGLAKSLLDLAGGAKAADLTGPAELLTLLEAMRDQRWKEYDALFAKAEAVDGMAGTYAKAARFVLDAAEMPPKLEQGRFTVQRNQALDFVPVLVDRYPGHAFGDRLTAEDWAQGPGKLPEVFGEPPDRPALVAKSEHPGIFDAYKAGRSFGLELLETGGWHVPQFVELVAKEARWHLSGHGNPAWRAWFAFGARDAWEGRDRQGGDPERLDPPRLAAVPFGEGLVLKTLGQRGAVLDAEGRIRERRYGSLRIAVDAEGRLEAWLDYRVAPHRFSGLGTKGSRVRVGRDGATGVFGDVIARKPPEPARPREDLERGTHPDGKPAWEVVWTNKVGQLPIVSHRAWDAAGKELPVFEQLPAVPEEWQGVWLRPDPQGVKPEGRMPVHWGFRLMAETVDCLWFDPERPDGSHEQDPVKECWLWRWKGKPTAVVVRAANNRCYVLSRKEDTVALMTGKNRDAELAKAFADQAHAGRLCLLYTGHNGIPVERRPPDPLPAAAYEPLEKGVLPPAFIAVHGQTHSLNNSSLCVGGDWRDYRAVVSADQLGTRLGFDRLAVIQDGTGELHAVRLATEDGALVARWYAMPKDACGATREGLATGIRKRRATSHIAAALAREPVATLPLNHDVPWCYYAYYGALCQQEAAIAIPLAKLYFDTYAPGGKAANGPVALTMALWEAVDLVRTGQGADVQARAAERLATITQEQRASMLGRLLAGFHDPAALARVAPADQAPLGDRTEYRFWLACRAWVTRQPDAAKAGWAWVRDHGDKEYMEATWASWLVPQQ